MRNCNIWCLCITAISTMYQTIYPVSFSYMALPTITPPQQLSIVHNQKAQIPGCIIKIRTTQLLQHSRKFPKHGKAVFPWLVVVSWPSEISLCSICKKVTVGSMDYGAYKSLGNYNAASLPLVAAIFLSDNQRGSRGEFISDGGLRVAAPPGRYILLACVSTTGVLKSFSKCQ